MPQEGIQTDRGGESERWEAETNSQEVDGFKATDLQIVKQGSWKQREEAELSWRRKGSIEPELR